MNEPVSTAVQSLATLVNILCLLGVVYVLREVMLLMREMREWRDSAQNKAAPVAVPLLAPPIPLVAEPITDPSPGQAISMPYAQVESAPLLPPLCTTCGAKVKKIVNSLITDGKTTLVFKCGRCTKETSVPEELVPHELLGPAR